MNPVAIVRTARRVIRRRLRPPRHTFTEPTSSWWVTVRLIRSQWEQIGWGTIAHGELPGAVIRRQVPQSIGGPAECEVAFTIAATGSAVAERIGRRLFERQGYVVLAIKAGRR